MVRSVVDSYIKQKKTEKTKTEKTEKEKTEKEKCPTKVIFSFYIIKLNLFFIVFIKYIIFCFYR
jgi:hypothetical protein